MLEKAKTADDADNETVQPLFTVLMSYRGGTYISQVWASDPLEAVRKWAEEVQLDEVHGLTNKSRGVLLERIGAEQPVLIDNAVDVWCTSAYIRGNLVLVNLVRTANDGRVQSRL